MPESDNESYGDGGEQDRVSQYNKPGKVKVSKKKKILKNIASKIPKQY
jgi:hypothetical protein|tara:strand:+ start:862 stop:1005 length:144 start_codon:yes stop_codon:yes gene_type:complete